MKQLVLIFLIVFSCNGIACLNITGINQQGENTEIEREENNGEMNALIEIDSTKGQLDALLEEDEEPKKDKKIIKGLIYYLGAGFVLLIIGMIFFLRKKPTHP